MHCEGLKSPHLLVPAWPMLEQAPLMDRETVPWRNQASMLAKMGPRSPRRAPPSQAGGRAAGAFPPPEEQRPTLATRCL